MTMRPDAHVTSQLPGYAAGTLAPAERLQVAEHVAGCRGCADQAAAWQAVGSALREDRPSTPPDPVTAVLRRAAYVPVVIPPRTGLRRHASVAAQLLVAQIALIRWSVWVVSALMIGFGAVLAAMGTNGTAGGAWPAAVLAVVAPIVAAAGIAGVCGPERDPGFELAAATMTSPRVVLLARVTLVFGFDSVLALVSSLALAGIGIDPPGLGVMVGAWLGPMALLSALCLLVSVAVGTIPAVSVALSLWGLRLLAPGLTAQPEWVGTVARTVESMWSTNLVTCLLALVLVGCAVALSGRPGHRLTPA